MHADPVFGPLKSFDVKQLLFKIEGESPEGAKAPGLATMMPRRSENTVRKQNNFFLFSDREFIAHRSTEELFNRTINNSECPKLMSSRRGSRILVRGGTQRSFDPRGV